MRRVCQAPRCVSCGLPAGHAAANPPCNHARYLSAHHVRSLLTLFSEVLCCDVLGATPPAHVDRARLPAISYRLRARRFLPPPKIQYAHRNRRGSPRRYQLQVRRLPTGRCAFERAFQRAPALSPRVGCRARHHGAIARHTRRNDCRYGQGKVGLSEFITPHNARAIEHRACWVRSLPANSPTSKSHVSHGASFCQV